MACFRSLLLVVILRGCVCSMIVYQKPVLMNDISSNSSILNVTCPADKPFMIKNGSETICVTSCAPAMVADGKNCIKVEDCKKPVLSDGKCMEMCDEGYLYVTFDDELNSECGSDYIECSYTSANIGQKLCQMKSDIILEMVVYAIGTILYIAFLLFFFSTWQNPCTKLINWIEDRNRMKKLSSREQLYNDDVTDDGYCEN